MLTIVTETILGEYEKDTPETFLVLIDKFPLNKNLVLQREIIKYETTLYSIHSYLLVISNDNSTAKTSNNYKSVDPAE